MMNIKKVTLQNKIYKTEQELFRIVTLKAGSIYSEERWNTRKSAQVASASSLVSFLDRYT